MGYRDDLFEKYSDTHMKYVDSEDRRMLAWFREHVRRNYVPRMPEPATAPAVLEIGCNRGYMLTALRELGYENLVGVDLSPADLEVAQGLFGLETHLADGAEFASSHAGEFDVIIMKAVLEHIEKAHVVPFLRQVAQGLKPDGTLIVEVPNMDWFFAQHERYMDFTHEVGFTRESLGQVFRLTFGNAEVHPAEQVRHPDRRVRVARQLLLPLLRKGATFLLEVLGEGGNLTLWHSRTIIGVARVRSAPGALDPATDTVHSD